MWKLARWSSPQKEERERVLRTQHFKMFFNESLIVFGEVSKFDVDVQVCDRTREKISLWDCSQSLRWRFLLEKRITQKFLLFRNNVSCLDCSCHRKKILTLEKEKNDEDMK